jgi:protein-tyrosine phosphatase
MTTRKRSRSRPAPSKRTSQPEPVSRIYKKGNFEVYLGNKEAACDQEWMTSHRIDLVINAMDTKICAYPDNVEFMFLDMYDGPDIHRVKRRQHTDAQLIEVFEAAAYKIEEARRAGKRVFVHCKMGQSRSATVVWYWLSKYVKDQDYSSALTVLKSARPEVNPNPYFENRISQIFTPAASSSSKVAASKISRKTTPKSIRQSRTD